MEMLPAYVEAQLKDVDVAARYPTVCEHLETCDSCRDHAELLLQLSSEETDLAEYPAPPYLRFDQWLAARTVPVSLWQKLEGQIRLLTTELEIQLAGARAYFADMPGSLAPRRAAVASLRTPFSGVTEEWLELPSPETSHMLKVGLGTAPQGMTTLILEVLTLQPESPIAGAKVSLNDENARLLESITSDQDGLAAFRSLEPGKYQIHVEVAQQIWQFTLFIHPATTGAATPDSEVSDR
jgi:hypothetical protein